MLEKLSIDYINFIIDNNRPYMIGISTYVYILGNYVMMFSGTEVSLLKSSEGMIHDEMCRIGEFTFYKIDITYTSEYQLLSIQSNLLNFWREYKKSDEGIHALNSSIHATAIEQEVYEFSTQYKIRNRDLKIDTIIN